VCVLAIRGNPGLEAHRDKLVVRMILQYTLCHISHLTSEFPLLGAASVTSGPCAHRSYSFLDINPLSKGHALVIPKCLALYFIASLTLPF
jgi:diadenosine tetraphosphate (Ap4A) HIT family hydrolase